MIYYIKVNKVLSSQSYSISLQMTEKGMRYAVNDHGYPAVMRTPSYDEPLEIEVPKNIRDEIEAKSVPNQDYMVLCADTKVSVELIKFISRCWNEIRQKDAKIF